MFNINSVYLISTLDSDYRVLPFSITLTSDITWVSFDPVISLIALVLLNQGRYTLQHFIYESSPLYFSIANIITLDASIYVYYIPPHSFFSSTQLIIIVHQFIFSLRYSIKIVTISTSLSNGIVQNIIEPTGDYILHNIVSTRNHIPHNIVFNSNISLSKHYLTIFLQYRSDVPMELILLIIPFFIAMYINGSFHLFHYKSF